MQIDLGFLCLNKSYCLLKFTIDMQDRRYYLQFEHKTWGNIPRYLYEVQERMVVGLSD